jgi:hypothetical protein
MISPISQTLMNSPRTIRFQLTRLLADYLVSSPRFRLPGSDGLTIEDVVIAEYPGAAAAGLVPGLPELESRHADLAASMEEFFVVNGMTRITPI